MVAPVAAFNSAPASGMVGAANEIVSEPLQQDDSQWVMLSPFGEFPNDSGRQVFGAAEAAEMVSAFDAQASREGSNFRGVPFYVGHPDAEPERYKDSKAYGWVKALQARANGLWARVKWSRAGRELIAEGHYLFVSPYWGMRPVPGRAGAYHPMLLISVGLTNLPTIPGGLPLGANERGTHHSEGGRTYDDPALGRILVEHMGAHQMTATDAYAALRRSRPKLFASPAIVARQAANAVAERAQIKSRNAASDALSAAVSAKQRECGLDYHNAYMAVRDERPDLFR